MEVWKSKWNIKLFIFLNLVSYSPILTNKFNSLKLSCLLRKKKSKSKNKDREERKAAEELLESASSSSSSKTSNEVDAEKYYKNKTKSEIAFLKKKQESVR